MSAVDVRLARLPAEELFDHEARWRRLMLEIALRRLERDASRLGFKLVPLGGRP